MDPTKFVNSKRCASGSINSHIASHIDQDAPPAGHSPQQHHMLLQLPVSMLMLLLPHLSCWLQLIVFVDVCRRPLRQAIKECELRWFHETAALAQEGEAQQMALLGHMYTVGYGCKVDPEEATKWFDEASKLLGYNVRTDPAPILSSTAGPAEAQHPDHRHHNHHHHHHQHRHTQEQQQQQQAQLQKQQLLQQQPGSYGMASSSRQAQMAAAAAAGGGSSQVYAGSMPRAAGISPAAAAAAAAAGASITAG